MQANKMRSFGIAVILCAIGLLLSVPISAAGAQRKIVTVALDGGIDSIAAAKKLNVACSKVIDRSECYQASLVTAASSGSVKFAMGTLDELGKIDEGVRRGGHVYAHAIGITAGKRGRDIASTFTQCSEAFQSGCYHGVIQGYFAGLDSIGASETNALCEPFRKNPDDRWIRFQCVHGMGHGLTMLYSHDLRRGLKACDFLLDAWDRHSCFSGAFMENIVNVMMPHHPASTLAKHDDMAGMDMSGMEGMSDTPAFKPIDPSDPLYPCSALADRYMSACYEMQTSVMLYENHGNIAAAAKTCDRAPASMRTTCYVSLGRDISAYSAQNHAEGIRMCGLGTEVYQPWCFYGLVKNFVDLNARPSEGLSLCRDVPSAMSKAECYSAVGEEIWVLSSDPATKTRLCSPSEPEYLDVCLFGARVTSVPPPTLQKVWNAAAALAR